MLPLNRTRKSAPLPLDVPRGTFILAEFSDENRGITTIITDFASPLSHLARFSPAIDSMSLHPNASDNAKTKNPTSLLISRVLPSRDGGPIPIY
jgi:hypothetical protein